MEKTFELGRNSYGDPQFEVTVQDNGRVVICEFDPHNGLRRTPIVLLPAEVKELFDVLNLK